ncbi:Fe-S metabolism associated SufE [Oscillochloris trichoides DG-6]|uniref:Fe-S metabolism associated SufE n=1 Tax=Oscillochloris trichoides DG-6 TaxID=765420 RepID=E1IIK1_9CHLR|nr:SufE family protein [Oscillochloris trichoides]EFO78991.1 Fe-S metabolism associated SufE [Oscillochloris trichoides DG-6]
MTSPELPPRLREIVEEFQQCDRDEKLELLLEFADRLPPLPEMLQGHAHMQQVHECMSPVFVYAEREGAGVRFSVDVPPEAPTTRGYAVLLAEGLHGATPDQVVAIPADFFYAMGLQQVLSPQRLNGISAILAYMKRLVLKLG